MAMRPPNSQFDKDFEYGDVDLVKPATQEDMKQGIDAWVGGIPFAWRRRRISFSQYRQLSIRAARVSGALTEYDKLLNGSFKAKFYVFQFTDSTIICRVDDIIKALKSGAFERRNNHDYATSAIYLRVDDVPHLELRHI
jgi:hypothetical protein